MPRRLIPSLGPLPPEPDLASLPRFMPTAQMREVHERYYAPISARSLENWPLTWIKINGYRLAASQQFLAECERRLARAEIRDRRTEAQVESRAA